MAVIENTVKIDRPIEEVFEYLGDLRNELEWNPKVRSMAKLSDGPLGVGTKFQAKWTKSPTLTVECTSYDRPNSWQFVNWRTDRRDARGSRLEGR